MKSSAALCLLVLFVGVAFCAPQHWFMKKSFGKAGALKRHTQRSGEPAETVVEEYSKYCAIKQNIKGPFNSRCLYDLPLHKTS